MKITTETAKFPVLRLFFKDSLAIAGAINRSKSYVTQRMAATSGKNFTELEKHMLLRAITPKLEDSETNINILFSEEFNPEQKNSITYQEENT